MDNTLEVKKVCATCQKPIEGDVLERARWTNTGRRLQEYCESCYTEEFKRDCHECSELTDISDLHDYDGNDLCDSCYDEHVRDDERDNDDSNDHSFNEREYSTKNLKAFQSKDKGEYITSQRVFSAELECYFPDGSTMRSVSRELNRAIGITEDGSLGGRGVEFQTPKLRGKNGEQQLKDICKVLNDNDFDVNITAGLHIHLDGKGLLPKRRTRGTPVSVLTLLEFYVAFEDVLLSFLPRSRRGNQYCRVMKTDFSPRQLKNVYTLQDLEKVWYQTSKRTTIKERKEDKHDSSRYAGLNLHSLFANNHLEIRYHSGTLDSIKILEWVNLHQTIVDRAVYSGLYGMNAVQTACSLEEKTDLFFKSLNLPDRAVEYFKSRQAKFSDVRKNVDESALHGVAITA